MTLAVPTRAGDTLKLVFNYVELENNFVLTVNGMPACLIPKYTELAEGTAVVQVEELRASLF